MFLQLRAIVVGSLILVLLGAYVGGQVIRERKPVTPPVVLSGGDVGFQITAREGTTPVGSIVVRENGKWVAVLYERGVAQISTR
jgi:hypothetical protein